MQKLCLRVERHPEATIDPPPGTLGVAHCWIKEQSESNGFHIARGWLIDEDWEPLELISQDAVTLSDYVVSNHLRFYQQAVLDGEVFLIEVDD